MGNTKLNISRFVTVIGIALLMYCCQNSNNEREKIFRLTKDELIKAIADENIVMGGAVGIAGTEPEQWVRFSALMDKTSEQEIIILTNHENNTIKCYAFMALFAKRSDAVFPVLLSKISDTGRTHTLFGCSGGTYPVNEFCVEQALFNNQITLVQKQILDSAIFFQGDSNLISRFKILDSLVPNPVYYRAAKERISQHPEYIILLSKYERPGDREIISGFLKSSDRSTQYWGIRAVSRYPDRTFFAQLSQLAKNNYTTLVQRDESYLYALYEALVRYRSQASRELLEDVIDTANGIDSLKKSDLIYQALKRYPDSVYKNLPQYF